MKGKDLYQFVRFGGMNLKKQKGYSDKAYSFHAPPANRDLVCSVFIQRIT